MPFVEIVSSHRQPSCFKVATVTLIIAAMTMIILGFLALNCRRVQSCGQFQRCQIFCKINPIYTIMTIVGGSLLYSLGLFGMAHFKPHRFYVIRRALALQTQAITPLYRVDKKTLS